MRKSLFANLKTVVIKVGTTVLTDDAGAISVANMRRLVGEVEAYIARGIRVVLVSSGSIAYGMETLALEQRPKKLSQLQACAAIGQGKLMRIYEELFSKKGYHAGQLLLTRDGLDDRARYMNAQNTLVELINYGVVPIVNENDTVATEEIAFGDNDVLAAQVATMVSADLLIILSDIDGLYQKGSSAQKVFDHIEVIDDAVRSHLFAKKSDKTKGGMESKLAAAERVMNAGISMIIANGKKKGVLADLVTGVSAGTLFFSGKDKKKSFKNWLAFSSHVHGHVRVDGGAVTAIVERGKSLLAAGVVKVVGSFDEGSIVSIEDASGNECARGIVNFSDRLLRRMKGKKKSELTAIIGDRTDYEVVHRDNMVVG